jgi:hypothetical protein
MTTKPSTLFFEHIPKTAGSTFNGIIRRQYAGMQQFRAASLEPDRWHCLEQFKQLPPQVRNAYRLVMGHGVLAMDPFVEGHKRYITFLREPVQQFTSGYYYIRRATWNHNHERVKQLSGLSEYLDVRIATGLDNQQTRFLCGDPEVIGRSDRSLTPLPVTEEVFLKALNNLGRMDHVGLTEHFDLSVLLMARGLGWKKHAYYQVLNRTKNRPDAVFDDGAEVRFRDAFKWDLKLYDAAQLRFQQDVAQHADHLERALHRYQQRNGIAQYLFRLGVMGRE